MQYYMGIDTGTQGVRIGVCDEKGNIVAASEHEWKTLYPAPGCAEQEPLSWWESIKASLTELSELLTPEIKDKIAAVCVDSTASTVLPVEEDGTVLQNALMWMDIRAKQEADEIDASGHMMLSYCGGNVSPEWFIPKVLWYKKHNPEIYKKTWRFVDQLDWINYKLCGVWASSVCNMTLKGNYVNSLGGYSEDFFQTIGFEDYKEKLIDRVEPIGAILGVIHNEIAEKYGFNPKMKVIQGGVDAHVGMFGTNAITQGKLSVIMGSSFVHLGLVEYKPKMEGIWGPYEDAIRPGTWCVEGGQASAAALIPWFIQNFHIDRIADDDIYRCLDEALRETKPGADGLVALDFFQGNRTPYKDSYAKGVIYGLTMHHTWKHIYRAILEAVSFGTYNVIRNFDSQGYHINEIIACGGVTKNQSWIQMIADVTGKPIVINRDPQAGVLGCCVIACAAVRYGCDFVKTAEIMVIPDKIIEPNKKLHEAYQAVFQKYLRLYETTKILNQQF